MACENASLAWKYSLTSVFYVASCDARSTDSAAAINKMLFMSLSAGLLEHCQWRVLQFRIISSPSHVCVTPAGRPVKKRHRLRLIHMEENRLCVWKPLDCIKLLLASLHIAYIQGIPKWRHGHCRTYGHLLQVAPPVSVLPTL